MIPECVSTKTALLGEGALWSPRDDDLFWVDILGKTLMKAGIASGQEHSWDMPAEIGGAVLRRSGGLVVVLRSGFAFFSPETGALRPISDPESDHPFNRFNDCCVDQTGRMWAGTMDFDAKKETGHLYRLDPDLSVHRMDSGYIVTNGPAFSPNGDLMYHNETMRGQVFVFDHDPATGEISNKQLLMQMDEKDGLPDGLAVDAEGHLWIAHVTGGKICRYDPGGRLLQSIPLPTPIVTSCAFGGPDLSTLFITTGRILLSEQELKEYPLSGSLFALETDTKGLPPGLFAG